MRKLARSVAAFARNHSKKIMTGAVLGASAMAASAQTDATAIVTSASTAFTSVATLCVTIGTFFIVYRLVRRVG